MFLPASQTGGALDELQLPERAALSYRFYVAVCDDALRAQESFLIGLDRHKPNAESRAS